nr:hypothetical protein [uncultured Draconibacterium sp.]
MKKILLSIILFYTVTSCLTVDRIKRNCDQFAAVCVTETETVVEYRDTTIYRHDTIKITLPSDTVKLTDTLTMREGMAFLPPVEKHFGHVGVKAWVDNSVLNAWGFLTDSTILQPVHDTILIDNALMNSSIVKYIELPPEKYKTWFTKFCTFWFVITLVVILGFVAYWVFKWKYSRLKDLL